MTYEYDETIAAALTAEAETLYFSDFADDYESNDYDTHFDAYSTFDENDYEYQQDLAMSRW